MRIRGDVPFLFDYFMCFFPRHTQLQHAHRRVIIARQPAMRNYSRAQLQLQARQPAIAETYVH